MGTHGNGNLSGCTMVWGDPGVPTHGWNRVSVTVQFLLYMSK